MIYIVIFLLPWFFGQQAVAALGSVKESWYEVEIIVFAQKNEAANEAEFWPEKVEFPETRNSVDVISELELFLDEDIEKLPLYYLEVDQEREDTLESLASKIENSSRYDLLIHRSWRQAVPDRSSGIPVYLEDKSVNALFYQNVNPNVITSEQPAVMDVTASDIPAEAALMAALLEEERTLHKQQQVDGLLVNETDPIKPFDQAEGFPNPEPVQLGPDGPPLHRVYGTVKLHKSRFLHMSLNFLYRGDPVIPKEHETSMEEQFPMQTEANNTLEKPVDETIEPTTPVPVLEELLAKEKPPIPGYQLKDSTRVRVSNTYYFDHPMFGVIARVIPYNSPASEDNNDEMTDEAVQ